MADFYGILNGKGEVTKTGTKKKGLTASVSSWTKGIFVEVAWRSDKEVFRVYETGGSDNPKIKKLIVEIIN